MTGIWELANLISGSLAFVISACISGQTEPLTDTDLTSPQDLVPALVENAIGSASSANPSAESEAENQLLNSDSETLDTNGVATSVSRIHSAIRQSQKSLKADIRARLIVAHPDWNRFRVQQGDVGIWCDGSAPGVRQLLRGARIGDELRIIGRVTDPQPYVLQFVADEVSIEARGNVDDIKTVAAFVGSEASRWGFVTYSGVVSAVYSNSGATRILATSSDEIISILVFRDAVIPELHQMLGREITVKAFFEGQPKTSSAEMGHFRLLVMDPSQIQKGRIVQTPQVHVIKRCPIDFKGPDYIIADGAKLRFPLARQFTEMHQAELHVTDWNAELRTGTVAMCFGSSNVRVSSATELSAVEILKGNSMYRRGRLRATIQEVSSDGNILIAQALSGSRLFEARFQGEAARQSKLISPGTIAHLTGTVDVLDEDSEVPFVLHVTNPADIDVEHVPLTLSRTAVRWICIFIGAVMLHFFIWRRSLKRQVLLKTNELQSLNALFVAATRSVRDAIIIFDEERKVLISDSKVPSLLGVDIPTGIGDEEVLLQLLSSRLENVAEFKRLWRDAFSNDESSITCEMKLAHSRRWLAIRTNAVLSETGDHLGRIWAFDDITNRKQLETEQLQTQKINAIGRLAGGVAHDFNNLLHVIRASLEHLQLADNGRVGQTRNSLQTVSDAVDRAVELTGKLLTFSRRTPVQTQVMQVREVIDQVSRFMLATLGGNIEFGTCVEDDCAAIEADPGQIVQVLMNLCLNSRDAISDSRGFIRIRAANATHGEIGQAVAIVVEDNGSGVPEESLSRVFDPFYTTKDVGRGTGLGLSMVYGVVDQLGGRIYLDSSPGAGTRVTIYLPTTVKNRLRSFPATAPPAVKAENGTKRILVVDDEPLVRDSMRMLLNRLGHTAECAAGGEVALQMLQQSAYDIVLLDLTMPGMSGHETLRRIRECWPSLAVVICSGFSTDLQQISDDPLLGVTGYLAKPYQLADIRSVLRELDSQTI
ncbi:MAG: response regulator [Planctomycetaceae bacterium]